MKNIILMGAALGFAGMLLTGCEEGAVDPGCGTIRPTVAVDPTVTVVAPGSRSAAELTDLTVKDLSLTLASTDGKLSETYSYSDFPTDKGFPIGDYTLTAFYGDPEAEGFDLPALSGVASFTLTEDGVARPELTATPSKAMLSIAFDESLTGQMTEISARVHAPGAEEFDYASDETRPLYLLPGDATVSVSFTKPSGSSATIEVATLPVGAACHYHMTLRSTAPEGSAALDGITVTYSDATETVEQTIDISEAALSVPSPQITAIRFNSGDTYNIVQGFGSDLNPAFEVKALGGMAKALLKIGNSDLGLPAEVDLCNPGSSQQKLEELGLGNAIRMCANKSKMARIELGHLLGNLPPSEGNEFALTVTDTRGHVSEQQLSLTVGVTALQLALAAGADYEGGSTVAVKLTFNGSEPARNLRWTYLTNKGVTKSVVPSALTSAGSNTYNVTLPVASDAVYPLTYTVECPRVASLKPVQVEIYPLVEVAIDSSRDIFASSVWVNLGKWAGSDVTLEVSTDEVNYTTVSASETDGNYALISGLTPGKRHLLRAHTTGTKPGTPLAFTTESATQIKGGDMESWTDAKKSAGANTWNYHEPESPWATLNEISLSKIVMWAMRSGAPCASRTSSDYAHGGSYAAYVRTVGYDASTTFTSKPSQFIAGELYTGTYEDGQQYTGTRLGSRPSAMTFWYMYEAFNAGDEGYAEVQILDRNGNILASGSKNLEASTGYMQVSIPLSYKRDCAKAYTVKVRFRSSATDDYLNANGVCSLSGGATSGHFIGSVLYIDDVELSY